MFIVYPAGELVQSYPFPKMGDVAVGPLLETLFLHSSSPALIQLVCGVGTETLRLKLVFKINEMMVLFFFFLRPLLRGSLLQCEAAQKETHCSLALKKCQKPFT